MTISIPSGAFLSGTNAERLAATNVAANSLWYETDTGDWYGRTVNGVGTLIWALLGGAGATGWEKYVVFGGGAPGPDVLYTTIAAGIAAALADGCGPAKPAGVYVMDGSYTESLTLQPGIALVALGGGGGVNARPRVIVTGNQTVADVAGTLMIDGIELRSTNLTPTLTVGGLAEIELQLLRSRVDSTAGTAPAVSHTNASAASSVILDDSLLTASEPSGGPLVVTAAFVNAVGSSIRNQSLSTIATVLASGSDNEFRRCTLRGTTTLALGTGLLERCTIESDAFSPIIGAATWTISETSWSSALGVDATATVTARRTSVAHPSTALAGAGPHSPAASVDTVVVSPGVDITSVVNLPDVTGLVEGDEYVFAVGGSSLGSAVVVLEPSGIQTFSDGALNQRLYEGGSIVVRVDRAGGLWRIVALDRGVPEELALFVNPITGSDGTGSGTAANPYLTVLFAVSVANRDRYKTSGSITVQAAGTETVTGQLFDTPGGVGGRSDPFVITGLYQVATGFAASYTTNAAGTAYAAGPPIVLTVAQIAANVLFATNAARSLFVRFTSGALTGQRFPIVASADGANATVSFVGPAGTAPGNGVTFVVEEPAFLLEGTGIGFKVGTGDKIQLNALSLGLSGTGVRLLKVAAQLSGCRTTFIQADGSVVALGLIPSVTTVFAFAQAFVNLASGVLGSVATDIASDASSTLTMYESLMVDSTAAAYASIYAIRSTFSAGALDYRGVCLDMSECSQLNYGINATQATGIVMSNVTVANTTAGRSALSCADGSRAKITDVRGTTEATTFGVKSLNASRITVTDPGAGGTEVTGGANLDAQVGVLAGAATTWALIATNAYASINDNAGGPVGGTGATVSV